MMNTTPEATESFLFTDDMIETREQEAARKRVEHTAFLRRMLFVDEAEARRYLNRAKKKRAQRRKEKAKRCLLVNCACICHRRRKRAEYRCICRVGSGRWEGPSTMRITPARRLGLMSTARLKALAEELGLPPPTKAMARREKQRAISALIEARNQRALEAMMNYPTPHKQAARIMVRFGGPAALAEALNRLPDPKYHRERTVIYKWLYPREQGGTDGLIPHQAMYAVKLAAREAGIFLTPQDWEL